MNVVRPAVQKNYGATIGRASLGVADVQYAGIDLLQRAERGVRPSLIRGRNRGGCLAR